MPYALLRATAHIAWKDCAPVSIKQIGSCFFFEFKDEATKLKVLGGGPYFFSRRYLVLKEWRRMLIPSTVHPSSIPAWIKIHKLPLECWTEAGLSRIASTIGKPIHVDNATAKRQRLDFARVCVEIEAGDELPTEVQIKVNGDSVVVLIEYQWLPSSCTKCKIFGHLTDSCGSKLTSVPSTSGTFGKVIVQEHTSPENANPPKEEWQVIGKAAAMETGGRTALEAITKFVPINTTTTLGAINSVILVSDEESETDDEEFVVDDPLPTVLEPDAALSSETSMVESSETSMVESDPKPPNLVTGLEEDSKGVDDPGIKKGNGGSQGAGIGNTTLRPILSRHPAAAKRNRRRKGASWEAPLTVKGNKH